jgi:hypothetical protein
MPKVATSDILNKACDIISDNLGSDTASTYRSFFEGESTDEIINSITELMKGLVGANSAKKQLAELVASCKST